MKDDEFAHRAKQFSKLSVDEKTGYELGVEKLIESAERRRITYMSKYRMRGFMSITASLSLITLGGIGFGWFLLIEADMIRALASILLCAAVAILVHGWARQPLRSYQADYKMRFMPEMAELLGGLKFHPQRGISAKLLPKTGIVPAFNTYQGEDCFMGTHKGVKMMLSEARLAGKRDAELVFDGLFVFLKMPEDTFNGHTIVTMDQEMVTRWNKTRWKQLSAVEIEDEKYNKIFHAYSDDEDTSIIKDALLKEITEMAEIFGNAPVSICFFRKSYVFMTIPYKEDMFEPSNLYVPITTRGNAIKLKKEVEQILSIIDILDLYNPQKRKEKLQ